MPSDETDAAAGAKSLSASDPERRLRLAAILLAAGASRRFGDDNKLLTEIDGKALAQIVAHEVRSALEGAPLIGVVADGERGATVDGALAPEVDTIVRNKAADEGIASSIRVGLAVIDQRAPNVDGLLIVQADMPNLTSAFVQHLCAVFRGSNGDEIIVPTTSDGAYRSPIIWPKSLFAELSRLSGDTGGRSILRKNAHRVRPVRAEDETVFLDIDTVDDLRYWRGQRR